MKHAIVIFLIGVTLVTYSIRNSNLIMSKFVGFLAAVLIYTIYSYINTKDPKVLRTVGYALLIIALLRLYGGWLTATSPIP